jgi:hypothetical protein
MVKALRVNFVDKSALGEGFSKAFVPGANADWRISARGKKYLTGIEMDGGGVHKKSGCIRQ